MLELGSGMDILRALGWLYLGLIVALIAGALWFVPRWWLKLLCVAAVLAVLVGPALLRDRERTQQQQVRKAEYEAAKAVFDERCKSAGMKIYRTVEDVDGVFLVDLKPQDVNNQYNDLKDPNWVDAGLPEEVVGDAYISTFLASEHPVRQLGKGEIPVDAKNRGALSRQFSNRPGYRYVDTKNSEGGIDRYHYNYALAEQNKPQSIKLDKETLNGPPARYVISRANHIDPADRAHWVAGVTVTITDTQTNEVLATSTWYSFEPGQGSTVNFRSPWAQASTCPDLRGTLNRYPTRFFVDQVLKPKPY